MRSEDGGALAEKLVLAGGGGLEQRLLALSDEVVIPWGVRLHRAGREDARLG